MENIYEYVKGCIQTYGGKVTIDFQKRSLKLDRKYIIKNGKYEGDFGIEVTPDVDEFLEEVEKLYDRYKHSVPSLSSERQRRKYFKALKENELDDDDMMFGIGRELAQFELEYYILCHIILGAKYLWENEPLQNKWFWQSSNDKDLVLLKDWFN